jgi:ATP-dependent Clp protease ATP-binding subunit ClpA
VSSGQRSAALAQYEVCRRLLAQELGVEPEAETRALYEQIRNSELRIANAVLRNASASHSQFSTQKHNLLAHVTPFVGREAEIEQLTACLLDPTYRLITLVGEGGIGKTRLALAAAEQVQGDFLQGVWLVPLAGLMVGELLDGTGESAQIHNILSTAIASALGFPFFGKEEPAT